jgi:hypothetical protein
MNLAKTSAALPVLVLALASRVEPTGGTAGPPAVQDAIETGSGTAAGCVDWRTEAVYRNYGYDHLVHLESSCEQAMTCNVTTDVNPDPVITTIGPGGKKTVVTFKGSPASEFSATVKCSAVS